MKILHILKVGSTFPALASRFGDYEDWILAGLGAMELERSVVDVAMGAVLPHPADCAGVVITGAHAMVTENRPWSLALEAWLPSLLAARVPLLGICYGHQLLARAAGGEVGYHPLGREIGTVPIELSAEAGQDPLFQVLPRTFPGQATHAQTVLRLPPGATRLAANAFEPNHAFGLGGRAWGVQFHPEYSAAIMRASIEVQAGELAAAGQPVGELLATVAETPDAAALLRHFSRLVQG